MAGPEASANARAADTGMRAFPSAGALLSSSRCASLAQRFRSFANVSAIVVLREQYTPSTYDDTERTTVTSASPRPPGPFEMNALPLTAESQSAVSVTVLAGDPSSSQGTGH